MFGIINDNQNRIDISSGTLCNNPKFVAVSAHISEENLYSLIKKYYDSKNKDKLLEACIIYKKYEYKKYLDILNNYIDQIQ